MFVSNLLDMTRLDGGDPDIRRDWVDMGEVIASAVGRARRTFSSRNIETYAAGACAPHKG